METGANWIPYCGAAPAPQELLTRWNLDPVLIAFLIAAACAGLWLTRPRQRERRYFIAAVVLLALLFVSPFCALTSALFSARAVHHLLLTACAAPLLAMAWPSHWGAPRGGAALWTGFHAVTFWSWHVPGLYARALSSDGIYWAMQASLLLTALALWRHVRQASPTVGLAALLATTVQMGLLGALLTFSQAPLYAPHLATTSAWGISPIEDQQLAGLIMWAPGAGLYLAAAVALLARWFERERRVAEPA